MTRLERARLRVAWALARVALATHEDAVRDIEDAAYSHGFRDGRADGLQDGHAAARRQIAERMGDVLAEVSAPIPRAGETARAGDA